MPRKAFFTRFPGFRGSLPAPLPPCGNGCAALTIGGRSKIKYPRLASPSFRAQTRNLWNLAVWTSTAPESTFVASACECGVAFGITPYAIFSILFAGGNPTAVPVRIWRGGNEFRTFFKIILGGGITLGYGLEKFLGFCKVCTVEFL